MSSHKTKDLTLTAAQLRVILELARQETCLLELELAEMAERTYQWNDETARRLRMRKRVTEGIAAKVLDAVQGWTVVWA